MHKPFAESCEQNKVPILGVLQTILAQSRKVLEIGSGTGQHAVFFGRQFPNITWQTSDLAENHPGILAWLNDAKLPNVLPPLELNTSRLPWPDVRDIDAVFTANTFHIMDWDSVVCTFRGAGGLLPANGVFAVYGPFNYHGNYTSDSNARFDQWLRSHDPLSGIRDLDDLMLVAKEFGFDLEDDLAMPVNNRTLVWRKT